MLFLRGKLLSKDVNSLWSVNIVSKALNWYLNGKKLGTMIVIFRFIQIGGTKGLSFHGICLQAFPWCPHLSLLPWPEFGANNIKNSIFSWTNFLESVFCVLFLNAGFFPYFLGCSKWNYTKNPVTYPTMCAFSCDRAPLLPFGKFAFWLLHVYSLSCTSNLVSLLWILSLLVEWMCAYSFFFFNFAACESEQQGHPGYSWIGSSCNEP